MKTSTVVAIVIVLLVVVGGIYLFLAMNSPSASPAQSGALPATTSAPSSAAAMSYTLNVANNPALGNYLVAANGMTLYHFTNDGPNKSNCTGTCATLWPPYVIGASDTLTAAPGAAGTIDTITRADGSREVTYNTEPLYYWHNDAQPGDTKGNNVGGVWFIVHP